MHTSETNVILIVDDTPTNLEVLSETLTDAGFEVAVATNGESAIQQIEYELPDLILLDAMMPEMDGWQFRVEQRRDPALASIPVIAVSADSSAKAVAIDADAYLRKPIDYPKLLETIDRLLLKVGRERLEARHKELDRHFKTIELGISKNIPLKLGIYPIVHLLNELLIINLNYY